MKIRVKRVAEIATLSLVMNLLFITIIGVENITPALYWIGIVPISTGIPLFLHYEMLKAARVQTFRASWWTDQDEEEEIKPSH